MIDVIDSFRKQSQLSIKSLCKKNETSTCHRVSYTEIWKTNHSFFIRPFCCFLLRTFAKQKHRKHASSCGTLIQWIDKSIMFSYGMHCWCQYSISLHSKASEMKKYPPKTGCLHKITKFSDDIKKCKLRTRKYWASFGFNRFLLSVRMSKKFTKTQKNWMA